MSKRKLNPGTKTIEWYIVKHPLIYVPLYRRAVGRPKLMYTPDGRFLFRRAQELGCLARAQIGDDARYFCLVYARPPTPEEFDSLKFSLVYLGARPMI